MSNEPLGSKIPNREDLAEAAAEQHFVVRHKETHCSPLQWSLGVQLPVCLPGRKGERSTQASAPSEDVGSPFHKGNSSLGFVWGRVYGNTTQDMTQIAIMLDPGANVTLIREDLLSRLGMKGQFRGSTSGGGWREHHKVSISFGFPHVGKSKQELPGSYPR